MPGRAAARSSAQPQWGFHRLSADAARAVVHRAAVGRGDVVVDLGAGDGVLTAALVDVGARVVAVELHRARAAELRRRFRHATVTVVAADVRDVRLPRRPFSVVANPPWALAETVRSQLLRAPNLTRADVVVPRWLARRWAAASDRIEVGMSLRAETFAPRAPTGAAVVVVHGRRRAPRRARRTDRS